MANSEQQNKILALGKLFVKELGLYTSADTFSKWMAHYIAEKMLLAEQLPQGNTKKRAEKECFEIILKLWEHRWLLPSGRRPLEEFEPILKTLVKLNPEEQESFFFKQSDQELSEIEKDNLNLKEIMDFSNMALQIDKTARVWIDSILRQAALLAINERAKEILTNAVNLPHNYDTLTIRLLLDSTLSTVTEKQSKDEAQKRYLQEKFKKRIEILSAYSKLNKSLLAQTKKELKSLK